MHRWWTIISAPWSGHIYRVEEPEACDEAIKNIERTYQPNHTGFNAFNKVMLAMDIYIAVHVFGVLCLLYVYFLL